MLAEFKQIKDALPAWVRSSGVLSPVRRVEFLKVMGHEQGDGIGIVRRALDGRQGSGRASCDFFVVGGHNEAV